MRKAYDKVGNEDEFQPPPPAVMDALRVALGWREAYGYPGPWVFFRPGMGTIDRGSTWKGRGSKSARQAARRAAKDDLPWTYSAALGRLRAAERATKVPHLKYRGFHGLRRYVINEILARTGGNLVLAGQYVRDKDLRTLQKSYVRPRAEALRDVADLMGVAGASAQSRNGDATRATTPLETRKAPLVGGASQLTDTQSLTESVE